MQLKGKKKSTRIYIYIYKTNKRSGRPEAKFPERILELNHKKDSKTT